MLEFLKKYSRVMYSLWDVSSWSNRKIGCPFMAKERNLAFFCMEVILCLHLEKLYL